MYYRYEVYLQEERVGGLFRAMPFVLETLAEEDTIQAEEDYEDLDKYVWKLEKMLDYHEINEHSNVIFYYTEWGNHLVQNLLLDIKEILEDWGYKLVKIIKDKLDAVVYEDNYQIATV